MALYGKPTTDLEWASNEGTAIIEPPGGLKDTGWSPGDRPPAQYTNWWQWLTWQWQRFFADQLDSIVVGAGLTPDGTADQFNYAVRYRNTLSSYFTSLGQVMAGALARATEPFSNGGYNLFGAVSNPYLGTAGVVVVGEAAQLWTRASATPYTWTQRTAGGGFTGNLYTATHLVSGASGVLIVAGASGMVQTAPYNGAATWTVRTLAAPVYAGSFQGSATLPEWRAVLVGTLGEIRTSGDGTTWTRRTPGSSYAGTFNAVAYNSGTGLIAVGSGSEIQYSTNGTTWTRLAHSISGNILSVVYGTVDIDNGLVPAFFVSNDAGEVYSSIDDGTTWNPVNDIPTAGTATRLAFLNGLLCVLADKYIGVCIDMRLGLWRTVEVEDTYSVVGATNITQPLLHAPFRSLFYGSFGLVGETERY